MRPATAFLLFSIALVVGVGGHLVVDRKDRAAMLQSEAQNASPPSQEHNGPAKRELREMCNLWLSHGRRCRTACGGLFGSAAVPSAQRRADGTRTIDIARTPLGEKGLASEDYIGAVRRYDRLIDPANPDALDLYKRATALESAGQTEKALDDCNAAIKSDPTTTMAFLGRGVLLAARKRAYDRAIQDFDRVLAIQPDNVGALIARGEALSNIGDQARALVDLNRAIALAPDRVAVYVTRGLMEGRRGNLAGAVGNYDIALRLDPSNVYALTNLAAIHLRQGRPSAALSNPNAGRRKKPPPLIDCLATSSATARRWPINFDTCRMPNIEMDQ
jgi:tetratricopeptide (TPR) repeat protein